MRKPKPVTGKFISKRNSQPPQSSKKKSNVDVGEMLGKLDSDQLMQLGNGVIELANNGIELAKETLKTGQVIAQAQADIIKSDNEVKKVALEESTKQKEIEARSKESELNYYASTTKEANSHQQVMTILDQVKNGKISPEHLAELISVVKAGA